MNTDARDLLAALRQAVVPEIENYESLGRFEIGLKAHHLWSEIKSAAELGDPDALEVMDHVGQLGCQKVIHDDKRRAVTAVVVIRRGDGSTQKRRTQAIRATRKVAPSGERYVQQAIWWRMTYDEIVDLFDAIDRAFVGAAEKRASFLRVIEAYGEHRDAPNAEEACRRAGLDPHEIEITDLDIRRARAA